MGMYGNSICSHISVAGGLVVAILSYIFFVYGVGEFVDIWELKIYYFNGVYGV